MGKRMTTNPPIPTDSLVAHGFSRKVIETWKASGHRELLPLQARALADYSFLRGGNLIVFAPTSSGKTFVAEMAALRHLEQGHKVVYAVPTKALAEEKSRQWIALYGRLGLRIVVSTRERPETDAIVQAGHFDVLIAVYEKLKSYLVLQPEILGQVRLVVVDELQMLGDPDRGAALELVLLKLLGSPSPPQLIALSAVLADATRLSEWLRGELLLDRERPVELREGALNCEDGRFYYTAFNSKEEGEEVFFSDGLDAETLEDDSGREAFLGAALRLASDLGEQVLVFVPTRAMSRSWAYQLANRAEFEPAENALEELDKFEPSHARDLMIECLRRGVAFHNAELGWDMRRLIEQHYNDGNIRVLFSTSTLGQGVNLSGRNVLSVGEMVTTDAWTGQPSFAPLSRERFRNQGGRAARFGREQEFGRSILLARNDEDVRRIRRHYLAGGEDSLPPALAGRSLEAVICDLVASHIARTRKEVAALLEASYTAAILWSADAARFRADLDAAIEEAIAKDLLSEQKGGRLDATGLGRVVAVQGVRADTAALLARWIRNLGSRRPSPAEMLLVAALTSDAADFSIPVSARERRAAYYGAAIVELIGEPARTDETLAPALDPPGGWTGELLAASKKALVLHHWIGPTETSSIEEQSGMFSGTIVNLAHHVQWLIQAMGALAESLGGRRALGRAAERLAQRLYYGVEPKCLPLAGLKVEAMTRGYLRALVAEGFDSIEAVAEADAGHLGRWVPQRVADELVIRARYELEQQKAREKESEIAAATRRPRPGARPKPARKRLAPKAGSPKLVIDEQNPERVEIDGQVVTLTPYPWDLLRLLAANAGRLVTYREIDEALWPDAKVEPQQISAHKRGVVRALAKVVGDDAAAQLVETVPRRGLRLNLPPENIIM